MFSRQGMTDWTDALFIDEEIEACFAIYIF